MALIAKSTRLPTRRADAIQQLSTLLAAATEGVPSVAVLRGAAFVGKTHLLAATAEEARRRSFRVAEVDARLSSLPFYAVDRLTRQLGVRNDAPADDLARLHGLRLACQRAGAGRAGVAIIVDNAESLSPGDAAALHDLMASPPLGAFFCLLTVGESASTRRTTSDLIGSTGLQRARPEWITLGPLTDEEVASIAEERLGPGLMTYRFVRDVCALSGGVAGHAVQIIQAVDALPPQDRSRVMTGSEHIEIALVPGLLVDDLVVPLQEIGDEALAVGRALAVLRGPATVEDIAVVASLPATAVERALGVLEDHGVLTTAPTTGNETHSWFKVPLIAVALRRTTPLLHFRTLNRLVAEMREGEGAATLPLDPDRLQRQVAAYFFASALPLTPERMDRIVDQAQQLVLHSRYAAARRLLEASIARAGDDRAAPLPPRAFIVLSEALSRSGENIEAGRALDVATSAEPSGGTAAETMIRQARTAVSVGRTSSAIEVLEVGLEREDMDGPTRLRLTIELARLLLLNRDSARGRSLCTEAYELAHRLGDRRTATEADLSLHISYVYAGEAQRALAHCRRALIGSAHPEARGRFRARALAGTGQAILDTRGIGRGLHWLRRAHREAEVAEDLATASWTSQLLAEGCIEHGDWDEAARWTARAVRLDSSLHRDRSLPRSRSLDARLRALRGFLDPVWASQLAEPQQEWADSPPATGAICIAHVEHAMLAGRSKQAHELVRATLNQYRDPIARNRALVVDLLPAAVTTACAMRDPDAAAVAIAELANLAELVGDELLIARPLLRFARSQVAALEDDWELVAQESAQAATEMTRVGYMWRAADASALAGEAHVRLKSPEAEQHLNRAYRTYREIGAQPRLTAVRDLLHEIGSRAPRTSTPTSVLTARQWQIARSAADGKTDAAIAAALSISRRTVTTHMHDILGRLDLTSRHQIADWFRENPEARR